MTLELEPLENSTEHLAATGWTAGISYDEEVDEDLMEEDREAAVMREEKKKATWCGGLGCKYKVYAATRPFTRKRKLGHFGPIPLIHSSLRLEVVVRSRGKQPSCGAEA